VNVARHEALQAPRHWQPPPVPSSLGFAGEAAGALDLVELDRAAADDGGRLAEESAGIAQQAGLTAEPVAVEAAGAVWSTIIEIADRDDAATMSWALAD
jgi:hypothetical protein